MQKGSDMISRPSRTWHMLAKIIDELLGQLSDDDLSDLHQCVETERQKRWLASYGPPLVPCVDCGFVRCECSPE
jgi:hypothetical protein